MQKYALIVSAFDLLLRFLSSYLASFKRYKKVCGPYSFGTKSKSTVYMKYPVISAGAVLPRTPFPLRRARLLSRSNSSSVEAISPALVFHS